MPENPNEYNDDQFVAATNKLQDAVWELWNAGASINEIEGEFDNALQNVEE